MWTMMINSMKWQNMVRFYQMDVLDRMMYIYFNLQMVEPLDREKEWN
jgi:hypothetical protein